jgi:hypothetical protein
MLRRIEAHIGVGAFDYTRANDRVFQGDNIVLPPYVTEMVRDRFLPQYEFLEETFGKAFVERT